MMAAHLQKTPVVEPLLAYKDRLDRGLHVVVDPARAGAFEESERPVMGIEHHLLGLARIGTHKHHSAMAKTHVGDLDRDRCAIENDDLVAPVELVSFPGRKTQRHIGRGCRLRALTAPATSIAPDSVITPTIAKTAKLLIDPDQRQPFARGLAFIDQQQTIQLCLPRTDGRQGLGLPLIGKARLTRPDDLAHRVARNMELTLDLLDGLALHEICPTNPCNRIHALHPPTACQNPKQAVLKTK